MGLVPPPLINHSLLIHFMECRYMNLQPHVTSMDTVCVGFSAYTVETSIPWHVCLSLYPVGAYTIGNTMHPVQVRRGVAKRREFYDRDRRVIKT